MPFLSKKTRRIKSPFGRLGWLARLRALNFALLFAIIGIWLVILSFAAPVPGFYGTVETDQVTRINNLRSSKGISKLSSIECLHHVAEQHTQEMIDYSAGKSPAVIYHTGDSNHDGIITQAESQVLVNRVQSSCGGSWTIIAENVGVTTTSGDMIKDSAGLFNAFVASPSHLNNIISSSETRIGVGAAYDSLGRLFITQEFASCGNCTYEWSNSAPTARRLFINSSGSGYELDSWGRVWPLGTASVKAGEPWLNWAAPRGRGMAVKSDLSGYEVLDGWGGISPYGFAPTISSSGYWSNWDIARDIAISDWSTGSGVKMDGYGGLWKFGSNPPNISGAAYWQGWDIAKRVALAPGGGYSLDGWGSVHPFGTAKPVTAGPYWQGWDIARALAISPDGTKGYVLDGWGSVHPLTISGYPKSPTPSGTPYWKGWDIAVDLVITDWNTPKGYVLDGKGGIHPFGGAAAVSGGPYWP